MSEPLTRDELAANLEDVLEKTAEFIRPCRACSVKIYFVRHKNGALAPYTFEGVNHYKNCTNPEAFGKKKAAS